MRHDLTLLYLGSGTAGDAILRENLRRQAEERGWCVVREQAIPGLDPDTPLELERVLERPGRCLLITEEESFSLAGRILSTLSESALELSATGILAPTAASEITERSYTLRYAESKISVVQRSPGDPYPQLPLEEPGGKIWHCFPATEDEERELLFRLKSLGEEGLEKAEILPGWIRIRACGEERIPAVETLLGRYTSRIIPRPTLVGTFIDYFSATGKTLTFAESCTGGRLAAAITSESGSSAILEGSYVTYANRIKAGWLGVRESTLKTYGAVSAECVREMARGAQQNLGADIAVAISGIAGPTGAIPGKPVGTVYFCVRNGEEERVERRRFSGDRNTVQEQAVRQALKMLLESEEKIFDFFSKTS